MRRRQIYTKGNPVMVRMDEKMPEMVEIPKIKKKVGRPKKVA